MASILDPSGLLQAAHPSWAFLYAEAKPPSSANASLADNHYRNPNFSNNPRFSLQKPQFFDSSPSKIASCHVFGISDCLHG